MTNEQAELAAVELDELAETHFEQMTLFEDMAKTYYHFTEDAVLFETSYKALRAAAEYLREFKDVSDD